MVISQLCGDSAARGLCKKTQLHQIRFTDIFQRDSFFAYRRRQCSQPDRSAVVAFDYHFQKPSVKAVKPQRIDFHAVEGKPRYIAGDAPVTNDFREIAHPFEIPVRDTRRTSCTPRYLFRAVIVTADPKYGR